jgi:hypothetical protein
MHFVGGLPETRCGGGSTIGATENVRAALPELLRDLGVKTMLDAPCGDLNWISKVDLGVNYIGMDYDPSHIKGKPGHLIVGDIVKDPLPAADLMLCRDFLQHLPHWQVELVFRNVRLSNIDWLLATSHQNIENSDIQRAGDFRPLNLMARPFSFPAPAWQIGDGANRILGLWHRDSL